SEVITVAQKRDIQQLMLVPVWHGTTISGAIAFARQSTPSILPFTPHEQDMAVLLTQAFARQQIPAETDALPQSEPTSMPAIAASAGINLDVQASYDITDLTQRVYDAIHQMQSPDVFVFITMTESPDVLQVTRFVRGQMKASAKHEMKSEYPVSSLIIEKNMPLFWRNHEERDGILKEFAINAVPQPNSFAGLPLTAREQVVGIMFSESQQENAFDEQDLQFMLTLANSAAFAIENIQLLENTSRRIYEMTIINDISNMLAQDFGSQQMWSRLTEEMSMLFPDALPAFCLYDAPGDAIYLPDIRIDGNMIVSPPESLARAVLSSGITLHFENIQQESARLSAMGIDVSTINAGELYSWLGTPLRNRNNEPVGVIALQSDIPGLFRSNDTALLSTLAAQVSLALDNTRLLHSQQERHRTASTLIDMGRVVSATLNVDEVYERIIEQMMKVLDFDRAAVLIPSPTAIEENCLLVQASSGFDPRYIHTELLCPRHSPLLKIISSQHPLVIGDLQSIPHWSEHGMLGHGRPRAWMGVPMVHQSRFIGLIVLDHRQPNLYRDDDASTVFALARQAAIAIENAGLHMEAARNLRVLEKRAHRLTSLHRTASIVNSSLTGNDILGSAAGLLSEIFMVDYCAILRFDDDENGEVVAEYPQLGLMESRLIVQDTASYDSITRIVQDNRTLVLEPESLDQILGRDHEGRNNYERIQAEISLVAPMITRDSVPGCIIISSRDPQRSFSTGDKDTFMTMATQIAMAIRNADLYEEAVIANRLKSEFLATVSHELRTPLNAIIGYSEMLINGSYGNMTEKQVNRLNRVYKSGKNLLDLISDILDLSRIEAGKLELERMSLNVSAILEEAPYSIQTKADEKSLKIRLEIAPDLPEIEVDAGRLRQVILNLLSNAVKFTHEGEICLTAQQVTVQNKMINGSHPVPDYIAAQDGLWLMITVSDTGIGIRPEGHELIFDAFRQLDGSTVREYEGTGLGLAITRQLVMMHNGFIWVESDPGKGSDFHVLLPTGIMLVDGHPVTQDDSSPLILVVDDDVEARTLVRDIVEKHGYRLIETENPHEVLALARQFKPAVIITDVMMPGMDGWNVLQVLKDDEAVRDIPVIVLSILDKESIGFYWGAAGYLTKPVRPRNLLDLLAKVVHPVLHAPILSVDNDPRDRKLVMDILMKEKYPVQGVASGEIALAWLDRNPASMILLDVMMPGMDGIEVLKALRRRKDENAHIPVIMITGQRLNNTQRQFLQQQNAYLIEKHAMTGNLLIETVQIALNMQIQSGNSLAGYLNDNG
ncbi:MAG: GAF domain-containing protein, partial [Aggregatilineales bacterium]